MYVPGCVAASCSSTEALHGSVMLVVVFDHEFAVGPRYPGSLGPAGTAGYRRLTLTAEFGPEDTRPSVHLAFTGGREPELPDLAHTFVP